MNVVLDFGSDGDGLDTLTRAVAFAKELRAMGFQVTVNGSLNVDAKWRRLNAEPGDPTVGDPTPAPIPKTRKAATA